MKPLNKSTLDETACFICDDNDLEDHCAMYITKGDDWYMTIAPTSEHQVGRLPIGFPQIRFRLSGSSQPEGLSHLVNMMHALGTGDYNRLESMAISFKEIAKSLNGQDSYELLNSKLKEDFERYKQDLANGKSTVHSTHCCKIHGCKYGPGDYCTVDVGLEKQRYDCPVSEQCNEEENYEDNDKDSMHSNYTPF